MHNHPSVPTAYLSNPIAVLAYALLCLGQFGCKPSEVKQLVSKHRDLPRHQYAVKNNAGVPYRDPSELNDLATRVMADVTRTLQEYRIGDPAEEVQLREVLVKANIILGNIDDALQQISIIEELPARESGKISAVFSLREILESRRAAGSDKTLFTETLKDNLQQTLSNRKWNSTGREIARFAGFLEVGYRLQDFDSVIEDIKRTLETNHDNIPADAAYALLDARVTEDLLLPYGNVIAQACRHALKKNFTSTEDIWPERAATLTSQDGCTPVTVAIWDSGVDTSIYKNELWINSKEKFDGLDNDHNGFIDDIHGIAHDLYGEQIVELLPECHTDIPIPKLKQLLQGFLDLYAGIDSEEAENLRQTTAGLDNAGFESLIGTLYGLSDCSHGTHVAGIAAQGNPFIRMLIVRGDYHSDPFWPCPEVARAHAQAQEQAIGYCRQAGVRVVNMSWSESLPMIERYIERTHGGATPAERLQKASDYFAIMSDSLHKVISQSPDILFVTSAGNTNQDVEFEELVPSIYDLPNLIAVGSVDEAANPPSRSSYGKRVRLHARGENVESFIVGGSTVRVSGTSTACPAVTNLAAKMLAVDPTIKPHEIVHLMEANGDRIEGDTPRFIIHPQRTIQAVKNRKKTA